MKRVIALGFFDGVHLGHRTLLARTRALADRLDVYAAATTFDRSPGKHVGLLTGLEDRSRLLKSLGRMDEVLTLPFDDALRSMPWEAFAARLCRDYGAVHLVCGQNYRFGAQAAGTPALLAAFCKAHGVGFDVLPPLELDGNVVSSSLLRELIAEGRTDKAARYYGHPHVLSGTVVPGRHIGRGLGFPTANLRPPQTLCLPRFGVYAVCARFDGGVYTGVCNVGDNPTVQGEQVTVEILLDGFDGDLYGKQLTAEFYCFLRPQRKFESLEALKAEISRNQQQARDYFAAATREEAGD